MHFAIQNYLPEERYDKIFCISVLEHIQDESVRKTCMDNFVKCLKPGGQLIITFDMVLRYGEKDLGFYMGEPEIREMLASLGIEYFKPAQFMTNTYEGGVVITALCLQIQF